MLFFLSSARQYNRCATAPKSSCAGAQGHVGTVVPGRAGGEAAAGPRTTSPRSRQAPPPPRLPAPSPDRRAGERNGRGDAPVSGRRGRVKTLPPVGKKPGLVSGGGTAIETRREVVVGGSPPSRYCRGRSRLPPSARRRASRALEVQQEPLKVQLARCGSPSAPRLKPTQGHACCGRPSFKSQLREQACSPPPSFFLNRGLHWVMRSHIYYATTNTSCNKNRTPPMQAVVVSGKKKKIHQENPQPNVVCTG